MAPEDQPSLRDWTADADAPLNPTQYGLPLEIYVFCKDKIWANYEAVQADIFDHLLAIAGEFDLKVYQYPSGMDVLLTRHPNQ